MKKTIITIASIVTLTGSVNAQTWSSWTLTGTNTAKASVNGATVGVTTPGGGADVFNAITNGSIFQTPGSTFNVIGDEFNAGAAGTSSYTFRVGNATAAGTVYFAAGHFFEDSALAGLPDTNYRIRAFDSSSNQISLTTAFTQVGGSYDLTDSLGAPSINDDSSINYANGQWSRTTVAGGNDDNSDFLVWTLDSSVASIVVDHTGTAIRDTTMFGIGSAVPEPSSTALLGLGGLALLLRRKK